MATDTVKVRQARRAKARQWLHRKKNAPCTDCKLRYPPCVMSFDHLPGYTKRMTISKMVLSGYNLETIEREVKKCELVCANCHLIRTHILRK